MIDNYSLAAIAFAFASNVSYVSSIAQKKAVLSLSAAATWGLSLAVAAASGNSLGAHAVNYVILANLFFLLVGVGAALAFDQTYRTISKSDLVGWSAIFLAVVAWIMGGSPWISLLSAAAIDVAGMVFVIMKLIKLPKSEPPSSWLLICFAYAVPLVHILSASGKTPHLQDFAYAAPNVAFSFAIASLSFFQKSSDSQVAKA